MSKKETNNSNNNKSQVITNKTRMRDIKDREERKRIYKEAKEGKYKDNKNLQAITKNIIPLTERSEEEAKAIRRKGAEATNRLKGERKNAKQILDDFLPLFANENAIKENDCISEDIKRLISKSNVRITQYDLIMLAHIYKAQHGDVKSAEYISNHYGDVVTKEVHNVNENMSESDKKLIEKLQNRLNIIDVDSND